MVCNHKRRMHIESCHRKTSVSTNKKQTMLIEISAEQLMRQVIDIEINDFQNSAKVLPLTANIYIIKMIADTTSLLHQILCIYGSHCWFDI